MSSRALETEIKQPVYADYAALFWFEAMSQAMDEYLRSTAFLELMQQSLRTMAEPLAHANEGVLVQKDSSP
jgi:hypothetical protein